MHELPDPEKVGFYLADRLLPFLRLLMWPVAMFLAAMDRLSD